MTKTEARQADIRNKIIELKRLGYSHKRIAKMLKEEFDIDMSYNTVRNIANETTFLTKEMIIEDPQFRSKIRSEILNTVDQMKKANEILWEIVEQSKQKGAIKISAINTVLKQLELQARLLGAFTPTTVKKKISLTQTAVRMGKILERLEKDGYIKIIKRLPSHFEGEES